MKKTPLRRKTNLKSKSCLKKKSKQKISTIQIKLWNLCKEITRKRYPHLCYTCGATGLSGSNLQTGHLWAKASLGAALKYDLRVLRLQCARCNLFLGGMGAEFYTKMLAEIGEEKMAQLQKDRQVEVRAYEHYEKLISDYQKILENFGANKINY